MQDNYYYNGNPGVEMLTLQVQGLAVHCSKPDYYYIQLLGWNKRWSSILSYWRAKAHDNQILTHRVEVRSIKYIIKLQT